MKVILLFIFLAVVVQLILTQAIEENLTAINKKLDVPTSYSPQDLRRLRELIR